MNSPTVTTILKLKSWYPDSFGVLILYWAPSRLDGKNHLQQNSSDTISPMKSLSCRNVEVSLHGLSVWCEPPLISLTKLKLLCFYATSMPVLPVSICPQQWIENNMEKKTMCGRSLWCALHWGTKPKWVIINGNIYKSWVWVLTFSQRFSPAF